MIAVPLLAALQAAPAAAPAAGPQVLRIDAGHSEVAFSIGFLHSRVTGRFDDLRGTLLDPHETRALERMRRLTGTED